MGKSETKQPKNSEALREKMSNKKRLIVDIDEAVHSRLKSEAAQLGVALGPYCASLLEQSSQIKPPVQADTS